MTTFLTLLAPYLLSQFFRAFLAVVSSSIGADLALSPADLGLMSAAWFWAFAGAQLPLGFALDRFGPRRVLGLVLFVSVAGAVWLALAHQRWEAIAAMALIGLGCAPVLMAGYYVLASRYPVRRFAMMFSLLIGLGSLGDPMSATPLALAVAAFGWRSTMLGIAAIAAATAILVWCVLPDPPPSSHKEQERSFLQGLADLARIRALWRILPLTLVGYGVVIALRGLWIAPFLQSVHGLDAVQRSQAALAMGLAFGFGSMAFGPAERWLGGPKVTVLGGTLLTAAALLALGLIGDRNALLASALLVAVGFFGMTYAIIMVHARMLMPAHLLGRGATFMNFVFMGGAGLTQSLSGRFVQCAGAQGWAPATIYGRLQLAFGLILLAAAAIYATSRTRPAAHSA